MTEKEELLIYGNVMHKLKEDGSLERIPRDQWDCTYVPSKPIVTDK